MKPDLTMKFSVTNAFLAALTVRAVSGRRIGSSRANERQLEEDAEFWNTFADERIASMVEQTSRPTTKPVDPEPVPGDVNSDAPSDGPSINANSNPPSDGDPTPTTDSPTRAPTVAPVPLPFTDMPSPAPSASGPIPVPLPITDAPTIACQTVTEVACSLPEFTILCSLVGDANLGDVLDGEDEITLFAPTNDAFEALPTELAEAIVSDLDFLSTVLLSHAVPGYIFSTDLECGAEISMINGAETTTLCADGNIFQTGAGNGFVSLPQIIAPDGDTCNGVIHAINQVIIPDLGR